MRFDILLARQLMSSRSVLQVPARAETGPTLHSRCQTRAGPGRDQAGISYLPLDDRAPPGGARRNRTDDLMLAKHALYQLSYGPGLRIRRSAARRRMVGPGRLELPTSRLSGVRSNQLSYGPGARASRPAPSAPVRAGRPRARGFEGARDRTGERTRAMGRKEKRRRRRPAPV